MLFVFMRTHYQHSSPFEYVKNASELYLKPSKSQSKPQKFHNEPKRSFNYKLETKYTHAQYLLEIKKL